MRKIKFFTILSTVFLALAPMMLRAQSSPKPMSAPGMSNPWTDNDLIEPTALAAIIKSGDKKPVILNIGSVEDIKGATHIGPASDVDNIDALKKKVASFPKNTALVIYCGCCPFARCPNVRPAFAELKKLGYTNVKLLNLSTNLNTNWIAKGYPLAL